DGLLHLVGPVTQEEHDGRVRLGHRRRPRRVRRVHPNLLTARPTTSAPFRSTSIGSIVAGWASFQAGTKVTKGHEHRRTSRHGRAYTGGSCGIVRGRATASGGGSGETPARGATPPVVGTYDPVGGRAPRDSAGSGRSRPSLPPVRLGRRHARPTGRAGAESVVDARRRGRSPS